MAKKTQAERVLAYIKTFGSISTYEAFKDLGVTRLSAVIFNLRAQNINIEAKRINTKNRYGDYSWYFKYYLKTN